MINLNLSKIPSNLTIRFSLKFTPNSSCSLDVKTTNPALHITLIIKNETFINITAIIIIKDIKMETTTIAVTKEVKEQIIEFGSKNETYSEILARLIASAKKRQLHDLLMSEEDTVPIQVALENAKKRWSK
jgi:predicted CopG family antitoxin